MVGTGFIAHKMAKEFTSLPTMPVVAVYSRSADTGVAMANEFHIPKVYTEYNEMLADPEVELVYIATPNSLHFEQAKAALLAGKHVLCEKPIVPTLAQLDELLGLAEERRLHLLEAITTIDQPMMNAPAIISASLLPVNTTISVTRQMTGYTTINLTSLIFLVKSAVTTSAIIVPAE